MLSDAHRLLLKVARETHPEPGVREGYVHDRSEDKLTAWAKMLGFIETQWPARGWRITPAGRSALTPEQGERDGHG